MPTLENVSVLSLGGLMVPTFRVRTGGSKRSHDLNVSQVSDGTLRVFGLLTALYQPVRPAVIALEEPEQTVHPGFLPVVAESISDVSDPTQVLVTTHSPEDSPALARAGQGVHRRVPPVTNRLNAERGQTARAAEGELARVEAEIGHMSPP